jgi:hypothetical protein
MIAYGRFLDEQRWRHSALFCIFAAAAILTKGTGIVLALLPPFAILFSRRWKVIIKPSFWLPALIVGITTGPWYLYAPGATNEATIPLGGLGILPQNRLLTMTVLLRSLGFVIVFAAVGLYERLAASFRRQRVDGEWFAAMAMLISFVVAPWVIPLMSYQPRYMVGCIPAAVMLAMAGLKFTFGRLPAAGKIIAAALLVAASALTQMSHYETRRHFGYTEVALDLVRREDLKNSVFLVASDSPGEGMFISEVAMLEPRPGHVVLRGTKVLAWMNWTGRKSRLLMKTSAEIDQYLESVPVEIVVRDVGPRRALPFDDLLDQLLKETSRWELLKSYDARPSRQRRIEVYRLRGAQGRAVHVPSQSPGILLDK